MPKPVNSTSEKEANENAGLAGEEGGMTKQKAEYPGHCYGCGGMFYFGDYITTVRLSMRTAESTVAYHWDCRLPAVQSTEGPQVSVKWLEELEHNLKLAENAGDLSCAANCVFDEVPRLIAIARAQRYYDRADSHGSSCLHYDEDAEPGRCDCGYDALREALKDDRHRAGERSVVNRSASIAARVREK